MQSVFKKPPTLASIANYLLTKEGALLRLISGQIIGEYEELFENILDK